MASEGSLHQQFKQLQAWVEKLRKAQQALDISMQNHAAPIRCHLPLDLKRFVLVPEWFVKKYGVRKLLQMRSTYVSMRCWPPDFTTVRRSKKPLTFCFVGTISDYFEGTFCSETQAYTNFAQVYSHSSNYICHKISAKKYHMSQYNDRGYSYTGTISVTYFFLNGTLTLHRDDEADWVFEGCWNSGKDDNFKGTLSRNGKVTNVFIEASVRWDALAWETYKVIDATSNEIVYEGKFFKR